MKRIFQTAVNTNQLDYIIILLRITVTVFMITHAIPKMNKLIAGGEIQFPDPIGMGPSISLVLTLFAELFCSILIGFGFLTRLAAFPLIITMAVAAFIVHAGDPFKQKELSLMYLILYIVLFIIGSGKYSVDNFISKKKKK
jgi:putative oxidoreductase